MHQSLDELFEKKVCFLIFISEIGKRNKQEVFHSADGKVQKKC